jgi:hypothetical protein
MMHPLKRCTPTRLRVGTYRFAALYSGNGNYSSTTSPTKTLRVTG